MCLKRGGEIGMDTLARRGCIVNCSTAELHSPKRSPGWLIAQERLFFLRDAGKGSPAEAAGNSKLWHL